MAQGRSVNKLVLSIVMATSAGSLATTAQADPVTRKPGAAMAGQANHSAGVEYLPKPAVKKNNNNKKLDGIFYGVDVLPKPADNKKQNDRIGVGRILGR